MQAKLALGSPVEVCCVAWRGDRSIAARVANRGIGYKTQWNYAGPYGKRVIAGIVFHFACADFGGDFGQRQLQNTCGLEFFFIGLARIVPTARNELFRERPERLQLFDWVVEQRGVPKRDHGTIVHGVIENGARQNQSIRKRDRNANREAAAQAAKHAACRRAVKKDGIGDAGEHRGNDEGLGVLCESHVAYKGLVEDFINGVSIVDSANGFADNAGSL